MSSYTKSWNTNTCFNWKGVNKFFSKGMLEMMEVADTGCSSPGNFLSYLFPQTSLVKTLVMKMIVFIKVHQAPH